MTFTLVQLTQTGSKRRYAFLGDREKGTGHKVTVELDMEMVRKYGISLQDLPLVCRRFLESLPDPTLLPVLVTFTEDKMQLIQAAANEALRMKEVKSWKPGAPARPRQAV